MKAKTISDLMATIFLVNEYLVQKGTPDILVVRMNAHVFAALKAGMQVQFLDLCFHSVPFLC